MSVKLSVVIPCYNMGAYVTEAIDSVLSYPNQDLIEIIVVNDGSNDQGFTKSVLEAYTNSNITIIHQENQGLGAARNNGIKVSRAPFIIALDADNKLRHEYIDYGISILEANPTIGIVYGDNRQFGVNNQDIIVGSFDVSRLLKKNYIDACVVLRKTAWESVHGYDENMPIMGYEDWDLNMRLFFKGWQFKYVQEICFDYRLRENSMLVTSNKNKDLLIDYMFSKPELEQAKLLRDKIIGYYDYKEILKNFKKRKVIRAAIKLERPIKSINKLFKK
ncbi:glycosyltransferase family 2 protein [Formosa maritima]|uniref:Glycosyltransferase family 2 protein n=1 Tax=Formosa maritima TaxID=2592046 RepID=A0A5D0GCA5_9FLAO|nr:glycosyltransferase family A protein [Formosa maritima]TYA56643.1 glycosyltransferase family 2 protein [Formosa maritima]